MLHIPPASGCFVQSTLHVRFNWRPPPIGALPHAQTPSRRPVTAAAAVPVPAGGATGAVAGRARSSGRRR